MTDKRYIYYLNDPTTILCNRDDGNYNNVITAIVDRYLNVTYGMSFVEDSDKAEKVSSPYQEDAYDEDDFLIHMSGLEMTKDFLGIEFSDELYDLCAEYTEILPY